jgi:hypothetical protein
MPLGTKALWVEDLDILADQKLMMQQVAAIGANMVCIRTTSKLLLGLLPALKQQLKLKVYGWRYPSVEPNDPHPNPTKPTAGYVIDEANYVAQTLIPGGIDGYIQDIESHNTKPTPQNPHPTKSKDWDRTDMNLLPLASNWAKIIKTAATNSHRPFMIGFTSHANCFNIYPGTPWEPFIEISDVLFPQAYWSYMDSKLGCCARENKDASGNSSPASALDISYADYKQRKKPIIPIGGEMLCSTADEIREFGSLLAARNITEGHFYTSATHIKPEVLAQIKSL